MISIKTKEEIVLMKKAGRILIKALDKVEDNARPGTTTGDLDRQAEKLIRREGGIPAFKGYKGFPKNICTSINNVVVHGIPGSEKLKEGDMLSIDIGVEYEGYFADAARTIKIGRITKDAERLINTTRESLYTGIDEAVPGRRLSNISHAIQAYVESRGYSVVRALVGHGIGSKLHEEPEIPNFGEPNKGIILKPGMTLAIEPMVNQAGYEVKALDNGWPIITKDGSLSAHFEHTILITKKEPEILTQ